MPWIQTARALAYLAGALLTMPLFVPPTSVRCTGDSNKNNNSNVVPYAHMNKTIRDNLRKQRFLKHVLEQLRGADISLINSSSSAASGAHKASAPSAAQEKGLSLGISQQMYPNITNIADSRAAATSLASLSPPNLVFSESHEKNILTFKFRPKSVKNKALVNKIHLWLYVRTKDKAKAVSLAPATSPSTRDLQGQEGQEEDASSRPRGKRLKIRVFVPDTGGGRGQRVAELKTRIETSTWGKLGLPVSLLNNLADSTTTSSNNTTILRLRIECKRCGGRTQVVMPGSGGSRKCRQRQGLRNNRKKEKRIRRWKKHCAEVEDVDEKLFPFIVIEEKSKASPGRYRRELGSTRNLARLCDHIGHNLTLASAEVKASGGQAVTGEDGCCKLVPSHVKFSRLKLDHVVVYPSELDYAICVQECRKSHQEPSACDAAFHMGLIADWISHRLQHQPDQSADLPMLTQRPQLSSGHLSLGTPPLLSSHLSGHGQPHPTPANLGVQRPIHQSQPKLVYRWFARPLRAWKRLNYATPARDTNNMVIFYFSTQHKLTKMTLPAVFVSQCQCRDG